MFPCSLESSPQHIPRPPTRFCLTVRLCALFPSGSPGIFLLPMKLFFVFLRLSVPHYVCFQDCTDPKSDLLPGGSRKLTWGLNQS